MSSWVEKNVGVLEWMMTHTSGCTTKSLYLKPFDRI